MKLFIILIFLFLYPFFGKAQVNLVPNPSFEETTGCPHYFTDVSKLKNWYNPTNASPDYLNSCETGYGGVPENIFGYQYAHSGNAYIHLGTYNPPDTINLIFYRDYMQIKLKDSLIKFKKYYVEYYVSLGDSEKYATNGIGCYFSKDPISSNDMNPLNYKPQIEYRDTPILDKNNWVKISGIFISNRDEQYLTIGNFNKDDSTKIVTVKGRWNESGYYIDDVFVTLCDTQDTVNVAICPDDSIYLQNKFQTHSGFYTDSLKNQYGCDSIVITNLSVEDYKFKNKNLIINEGDSVLINGKYRSQQGIYYDTLKTHASCDSIIITNLIVEHKLKVFPNPSSSGEITISYFINNNSLVQFKLVDFIGREVMSINCGMKPAGDYSNQVNISELAAGIYLLIANINGEYPGEHAL